ncbi:MAG TPA: hypothetical protein VML96_03225 [Egibacteraceae bacterium]|nr:hypothetical protein [Egibacteraceae bacterium]
MGIFAKDPSKEEQPGGSSGLHLDLDELICPDCRRALLPWQRSCPDDGATAVPRAAVSRTDLPPPPPHLLEPDDEG